MSIQCWFPSFFFFNDTATTEIYTLSLHDALPISFKVPEVVDAFHHPPVGECAQRLGEPSDRGAEDRKSTRLNSSHQIISYAVFCLKKKKLMKSMISINIAVQAQPWCTCCVSITSN